MTAHVTVMDGNVLRILELVGDQAVEVARISLRDIRPAAVTSIVANLVPHLAPAGLNILINGDQPMSTRGAPRKIAYQTPQQRESRAAALRAYVAEHPGETTGDIARAVISETTKTGSGIIAQLQRAGLHGVHGEGLRGRAGAWRWYLEDPALKVKPRKEAAS